MVAVLKDIVTFGGLKVVATIVFLVEGIILLLSKQPPKLIQNMNIAVMEKRRLKNLVGGLILFAALLYPVEVLISVSNLASQDFLTPFWGRGLIVIGLILMLLLNYFRQSECDEPR